MPDASTLLLFVGASLALLVIPGPAVLFLVTRSVDQGRRAGLVSMLGVETGTFAYAVAAAVGLTGLIAASELGFTVVKYAGAAYLCFLGIRKLREPVDAEVAGEPRAPGAEIAQQRGVGVGALQGERMDRRPAVVPAGGAGPDQPGSGGQPAGERPDTSGVEVGHAVHRLVGVHLSLLGVVFGACITVTCCGGRRTRGRPWFTTPGPRAHGSRGGANASVGGGLSAPRGGGGGWGRQPGSQRRR